MDKEIKEILECLKKYGGLTPDAIDDLIYIENYITNLQQENERLKEILKWKQNRESELFTIESVLETNKQLCDERDIYRQRINKAIEYIKNCEIVDKNKRYPLLEEQFGEDLLNILQNGSENDDC